MKDLVDNIIELNIYEILNYDFPIDEPFGLKVNYKDVPFDFVIRLSSKNKNLICTSPGAHQRNRKTSKGKLITPPFIDRWSWFKYFDESYIAHSDPMLTMDDELVLGWCVGTKDHWYLETIAKIIDYIAINHQIRHDNILFYGTSNGGFVSMVLATFFKGSSCLVNNSQFSAFNYKWQMNRNLFSTLKKKYKGVGASENRDYVDKIYRNNDLYQMLSESERDIVSHIYYRIDLMELFKKEKYVPEITYYLHARSDSDVNKFAIPFLKEIINFPYFNDRLNVMIYHEKKDNPHSPLYYNKIGKIIRLYSEIKLNNPRKGKRIGFFDHEDYKDEITKEKFEIDYYKENLGPLSKYRTARIDLKNKGISTNNIEIIENSDKNAEISHYSYSIDEKGIGTQMQSEAGSISLKIKCINDGVLDIRLRGVNHIYENEKIPIYIKYTNFEINNEKILQNPVTVWHDKPFYYLRNVKNMETVDIYIEWEPI